MTIPEIITNYFLIEIFLIYGTPMYITDDNSYGIECISITIQQLMQIST